MAAEKYTIDETVWSSRLSLFRLSLSTSWLIGEMLFFPIAAFLFASGLLSQPVLFGMVSVGLLTCGASVFSGLLITRTIRDHRLPRTIRSHEGNGTFEIVEPIGKSYVSASECEYAFGSSIHDSLGDGMQNIPAMLIKMPIEDELTKQLIVAIPTGKLSQSWERYLAANSAGSFEPDKITFSLRVTNLGVRLFGRGLTLGLLLAPLIVASVTALFGRPAWVPSIYLLSCLICIFSVLYLGHSQSEEISNSKNSDILLRIAIPAATIGAMISMEQEMPFSVIFLATTIHALVAVLALAIVILASKVYRK